MSARVAFLVAAGCALAGGARPAAAQAVAIDAYAWQAPVVSGIGAPAEMIDELRGEVQRILDAGHLAPIYISYADQDAKGYKLYMEPGRVIGTLAQAWPYLTTAQQQAVRTYVAAELADPRFAPWAPYPLPPDVGARRELHPPATLWSLQSDFGLKRPSVQTIYGLWLYTVRSGDTALVAGAWGQVKQMYAARAGQGDLYGTMGAHIGEARLADLFGDTGERAAALANLQQQLDSGLDFDAVEQRAWNKTPYWESPYLDMYAAATAGSSYRGWIFLNLSPEIGRYLAEHVQGPVLARHNAGKARFPLWWLAQASYFLRSRTGDEGIGLLSEEIGMIAPVERWVAGGGDPAQWRLAMRSNPTGRGDCYWIEALVLAIEAHGTVAWRDVRRPDETLGLRFTDRATLAWDANPGAASYRVVRGAPADLPALAGPAPDACTRWTGAAATTGAVITERPPAGSLLWYLVLGVNAYGDGRAGRDALGERSVDLTGSCPP